MDAQIIGVATAVISTAVAALGLLLGWYRHEEDEERRRGPRRFIAAGIGIVFVVVLGITLIFIFRTGADTPSTPDQLTEDQYMGQVGAICSHANEQFRRLGELRAQEPLLGSALKIEEDEVIQLRQLRPPDKLKSTHDNMVSIWQRRINLLDEIYQDAPQRSQGELDAAFELTDQLARQLAQLFDSLRATECSV